MSRANSEGITDTSNSQDDNNVEGMQSRQHEPSTTNAHSQQSMAQAASVEARQRRRIAQLEEKLEALESGRAVKEKYDRCHPVIHFTHRILGKQTISWLKEGRSGALSLYLIILRTSLLKMIGDMEMITKTIPSSKFYDFQAELRMLTMGLFM
jgi:hypothetical protein